MTPSPVYLRPSYLLCLLLLLPFGAGCDGADTPPPFDFDRFFAPPTQAEVSAVLVEWEARAAAGAYDPGTVVVEYEGDLLEEESTVYIVRHTTGASTEPHYGAVRVPAGGDPLPVLVVNHGGDLGLDLSTYLGVEPWPTTFPFAATWESVITVFPTFRSEMMRTPGGLPSFTSGGAASPWDRDVDDALALLHAVFQLLPDRADPGRVGTLGFSRGAGVSLLMAARPLGPSPPFDIVAVANYFGPTDFLSPVFRAIAAPLLFEEGTVFEALPGARHFQREVLQPILAGTLSYEEGRLMAVRRSAAYFAGRLPNTQSHHHRRDAVVPFDQFEALRAREGQIGGVAEFYAYGEAGAPQATFHSFDPLVMPGHDARTAAFFNRFLLEAEPLAAH